MSILGCVFVLEMLLYEPFQCVCSGNPMIGAFASLSLSPFSENSEERKVFAQSVGGVNDQGRAMSLREV